MLKSAKIINYQKWKNLTLNFSPGINIIVGESDTGKSAIFRSLFWARFGRPIGHKFITRQQKTCIVQQEFDNCTITRTASSSRGVQSSYILEKDGKSEELEALDTKIPSQIEDAFATDRTNYKRQFDNHFLIGEKNSEVARVFSELLNLQEIQATIAIITSNLRTIKDTENNLQEIIDENKQVVAEYHSVEDAERVLIALEELDNSARQQSTRIAQLQERMFTLEEHQKELDKYAPAVDALFQLEDIQRIHNNIASLRVSLNTKSAALSKLIENRAIVKSLAAHREALVTLCTIEASQNVITALTARQQRCIELLDKYDTMTRIVSGYKTIKEAQQREAELTAAYEKIKERQKTLASLVQYRDRAIRLIKERNAAKEEYEALLLTLPNLCPTCGQPILGEDTCVS